MTKQRHDRSAVNHRGCILYLAIPLPRCSTSLPDPFHVIYHFFVSGNTSADKLFPALSFRKRQGTSAVDPSLICRISGKFLIIMSLKRTEIHLCPLRDTDRSLPRIQDLCGLKTPLHGTGKQDVGNWVDPVCHGFFQCPDTVRT